MVEISSALLGIRKASKRGRKRYGRNLMGASKRVLKAFTREGGWL